MRVVLAGASGLIGSELASSLRRDGIEVATLARRAPQGPDEDSWDPDSGRVDPDFLTGADAVVCLSGAGVGRRWTEAHKRRILSSRVNTVSTLARSLAEYGGPRTLICASAVGYYGDTEDRTVDEKAPPGASFLADVCVHWEAAAQPARDAGVRVVHLRTGLVLSRKGGLLKPLALAVKAGVGGRLGSGRQYMPWISIVDEIAAIRFAVTSDVAGPLNLSAPAPATNLELTRALGRVLRRPTAFVVPSFAARLALGEFAGEVLGGQRAVPRALLDAGFSFTHPELDGALRAELA